MSKRIKDLPTISSLQNSTEMPVGDGTTNTGYKTTLNALKSYISSSPLSAPLIVDEATPFSGSVGTISWTKGSTTATLSNTIDHTAIQVNDAIVIGSTNVVATYVVSKGVFPNITILSTHTACTGFSFSFGQPSYIARDSSGVVNTEISQAGVLTSGSILAHGASAFKSPVYIEDTVNVDKLRSTDGSYSTRVQFDDGMHTNPYRPGWNASMSAGMASVATGTWVNITFNVVNGTDPASCTFTRVPVGASGYDTANYLFKVPYVSGQYSETIYTIMANLYFQMTSVVPPNRVLVRIVGVSSTAWASPLELCREEFTAIASHSTVNQSVDVTRVVKLNPNTVTSHRYLGVQIFHTYTALTVLSSASNFSGVCNG